MHIQSAIRFGTFFTPDPTADEEDEAWRAFGEGYVWDNKRADDAIRAAAEHRQNGRGHKVDVDG